MKNWATIQRIALGSHGIVTFAQARSAGVFPAEIYRWCKNERLMRIGRGVFRLTAYPSQGFVSDMASLLALAGQGAYLCGESALALYDLCPTRSYVAVIAVPGRFRKTSIPKGVTIVKSPKGYSPTYHDGIPCQKPMDAIRFCIGTLEKKSLIDAVNEAEDKGYFMAAEAKEMRKEIEHGKATA